MTDILDFHPVLPLLEVMGDYIKLAVLASQRMLAALMVIPFLSQGSLPALPRHAIVVVLIPFVIPLLPPDVFDASRGLLYLLSVSLREVAIGVFIGMVIAVPLIIMEGVGHTLDFQSGLSNAAVFDPATNEESGPFGKMFSQVALWLLFGPIGIVAVITVLLFSYELWPVASSGPYSGLTSYKTATESTGAMLRAIVILAAPAVVALLLVEFSLGLIGRFAQQLDVNISAMPLKTLIAAGMAALMLSYMLEWVREERSWSDRALHFMRDATAPPKAAAP